MTERYRDRVQQIEIRVHTTFILRACGRHGTTEIYTDFDVKPFFCLLLNLKLNHFLSPNYLLLHMWVRTRFRSWELKQMWYFTLLSCQKQFETHRLCAQFLRQLANKPVSYNLGHSFAHSLSRSPSEVIFQIMDFNGGESSTLPTLLCCHTSIRQKTKHRENEIDNSNGNNKSNIAYDI